jgi:glycosyltransferase involved in cell wall biosynthesis
VPAADPRALAAAVVRLAAEPERTRALGDAAARAARTASSFASFMGRLEALYAEAAARP